MVPPSQGRVYRPQYLYWRAGLRSALTRAGISCVHLFYAHAPAFRPHKGGYIAELRFYESHFSVPPSQGRVYHDRLKAENARQRSALTRAGISGNIYWNWTGRAFRPHKGGYINQKSPAYGSSFRSALTRAGISKAKKHQALIASVPPSQGRVYHQ